MNETEEFKNRVPFIPRISLIRRDIDSVCLNISLLIFSDTYSMAVAEHHNIVSPLPAPKLTLFLKGLPEDIKDREVRNLFRFCQGFVGCKVSAIDKDKVAWVLFSDESYAAATKAALHNTKYDWIDPDSPKMTISFARTNLGLSRDWSMREEKSPKLNVPPMRPAYAGYGYGYAMDPYGYASFAPQPHAAPRMLSGSESHKKRRSVRVLPGTQEQNVGTPSNTLFISNMHSYVQDEELHQIAQSLEGYSQISIGRKGARAFCFIEMRDQQAATEGIKTIQGLMLATAPNEDGTGIKVQYSKKPFSNPPPSSTANRESSSSSSASVAAPASGSSSPSAATNNVGQTNNRGKKSTGAK